MQGQYTTNFNLSQTMFKITIQQYVQSQKHGSVMMKMILDTRKSHHLVITILSKPCKNGKKGGGIAVVYKASLNIKECPTSPQTSEIMEYMELTINFKGIVCNIYIIYNIPNTSVIQFCSELSDLIKNNVLEDHGHIIMLDATRIYTWTNQNTQTQQPSMIFGNHSTYSISPHFLHTYPNIPLIW